ncbi:hypothetical protein [Streptomyces sp. NPDC001070]
MVLLYPPAWRARYGPEFRALLDDMRIGPRQLLDIAIGAVAAWARPARRLHDRPARLRTTVTVVLYAWSVLAAGGVLFAKITHDGAWSAGVTAGSEAARWYDGFVLAGGASAVTLALGMLPLLMAVPAAAHAAGRLRGSLTMLAWPLVAPPAFLGTAAAASAMVGPRPGRALGAIAFLALAALGVATALACAAGPAVALARARPQGTSLKIAVVAGAGAVVLMAAATGAALASELLWPGHGATVPLTLYAAVTTAVVTIAAISCRRGLAILRSAP